MKQNLFSHTFYLLATLAIVLFSSCENEQILPQDSNSATLGIMSNSKGKTSTSNTAQSVAVEATITEKEIETDIVYVFDQKLAATYFGKASNANGLANSQKCTFFQGGTLSNGITVNPKTAWKTEGDGNGTANPVINIRIAAQSLVNHGKKDGVKYSFSLQDRISWLSLTVTDENGNTIDPGDYTFTYESNPDVVGAFHYVENGGTFGSSTNDLKTELPINEILALNKFGSTAVSGEIVVLSTITLPSLEAGIYTITVSGLIKGNDMSADTEFAVTTTGSITDQCNK